MTACTLPATDVGVPLPPGNCTLVTNAADNADVPQLTADYQGTAVALYQRMASQTGSFVLSPWAVTSSMATLLSAAKTSDVQALLGALGWQTSAANLTAAHGSLTFSLVQKAADANAVLGCANRVWADRTVSLQPAWVSTLTEAFGAEDGILDFAHDARTAALSINRWAAAQTANDVPPVLDANASLSGAQLVLTSGLSAVGHWKSPWTATHDANNAIMLYSPMAAMRVFSDPNVQMADLPLNGNFALLLVMPHQPMSDFETAMDAHALTTWLGQLQSATALVAVPPVAVRSAYDVTPAWQAWGLGGLLDGSVSLAQGFATDPLKVARVATVTEVIVTATGLGGTPVTGAQGSFAGTATHIFAAPFMFIVHDTQYNMPLMWGRFSG